MANLPSMTRKHNGWRTAAIILGVLLLVSYIQNLDHACDLPLYGDAVAKCAFHDPYQD